MPDVYRAEVVGSLLRPAYLLEARKKIGALRFGVRRQSEPGELSLLESKRLEHRAVDEAIAIQQYSQPSSPSSRASPRPWHQPILRGEVRRR